MAGPANGDDVAPRAVEYARIIKFAHSKEEVRRRIKTHEARGECVRDVGNTSTKRERVGP